MKQIIVWTTWKYARLGRTITHAALRDVGKDTLVTPDAPDLRKPSKRSRSYRARGQIGATLTQSAAVIGDA